MPVETCKKADVVIIGGGPAGLSAALWCDELGLDAILIEGENDLGGQLRHIYNPIENYLGLSAENGLEMLSRFEESLSSRNFVPKKGIKVTSIDVRAMEVRLSGQHDDNVFCKAMILATGVRRRLLGVSGEAAFRGKGILESGSKERDLVLGKRVLIVGGGDAAFENALILSKYAASVLIAYRRNEASGRPEFVDAARRQQNVEFLPATVVTGIAGDLFVEKVELKDAAGRLRTELVDAILIRIGVEPNSELVRGILELDASGYIKVDHTGKTNIGHVYAVGDVANKYSLTLSTATGSAATVTKTIFQTLKNREEL